MFKAVDYSRCIGMHSYQTLILLIGVIGYSKTDITSQCPSFIKTALKSSYN